MYNLESLNNHEFETLCCDIMSKKLKTELRTYKSGRDGGVDIRGFIDNDIIVQAKHYCKSKYSNLLTDLKKEVEKVKKLNPKQYYIVTSFKLSPQNETEIFNIFKDFMKDKSNIIDGVIINDFLSDSKNNDIVKKHYKLWIVASNVLSLLDKSTKNIQFDTDSLIDEIKNDSNLYVETDLYKSALKILSDKNIIIIKGDPGVGKTTMSKMLVLKYIEKGYQVIYSEGSYSNIDDIKKYLNEDPESKEILLLDDFLGQHYLDIESGRHSLMKSLISYIKRNKNKKLILNTRITILNQAMNHVKFDDMMNRFKLDEYLIDLNKMNVIEKANILFNHIWFKNLPEEYYEEILKHKRYKEIVRHKNYNPRIIEYITTRFERDHISSEDYYEYIVNKLDNPKDVWSDEFKNRMNYSELVFINTLYSLTNTSINIEILKKCYNARIAQDRSVDPMYGKFYDVCNRLTKSIIILQCIDKTQYVRVLNPSINDYISNELKIDEQEIRVIVDNAIYIEQITKFIYDGYASNNIKKKICNGEIFKLKTLGKLPMEYNYLFLISKFNIKNKDIIENINKSFIKIIDLLCNYKFFRNAHNITTLIDNFRKQDLISFYDLDYIIVANISNLMENLEITYFLYITEFIISKYQNTVDTYKFIVDFIEENEYEIVENIKTYIEESEDYEARTSFILERYNEDDFDDISSLASYIESDLESELESEITDMLGILEIHTSIDKYSIVEEIIQDIDFEGIISDYYELNFLENKNDDIKNKISNDEDEDKAIESIFAN